MTYQRQFVITLQAAPGIGSIHALRALLKTLLRHFGLRCIAAREEHPNLFGGTSPTTQTKGLTMVTRGRAFPDRFLRGSDLKGPTITTINEAVMQVVKDYKSGEMVEKVVLHFDTCSPLILTYDNFCAVADLSGEEDSENWHGVAVELHPVTMLIGGKEVVAVRIRAPNAPSKAARTASKAKPADPDDSISF
jgi:hypothetical protein